MVWKLLFEAWFDLIIPDLPGFWKTKINKVYELEDYANIIEQFIKELDLKNIILWWHSNGWAISIQIAIRNNINISNLILNNSAWIRNDTKRSLKRKILNNFTKVIKKVLSIIPPRKNWNKSNNYYKKIRKLFYKAIWWQDYLNAENNPFLKETYLNMIKNDLSKDVFKIKQNTLLIWWKNDRYTPLNDWLYLKDNIINSKIIILENEKHWIHLTSPEKLVNTFLNNI